MLHPAAVLTVNNRESVSRKNFPNIMSETIVGMFKEFLATFLNEKFSDISSGECCNVLCPFKKHTRKKKTEKIRFKVSGPKVSGRKRLSKYLFLFFYTVNHANKSINFRRYM